MHLVAEVPRVDHFPAAHQRDHLTCLIEALSVEGAVQNRRHQEIWTAYFAPGSSGHLLQLQDRLDSQPPIPGMGSNPLGVRVSREENKSISLSWPTKKEDTAALVKLLRVIVNESTARDKALSQELCQALRSTKARILEVLQLATEERPVSTFDHELRVIQLGLTTGLQERETIILRMAQVIHDQFKPAYFTGNDYTQDHAYLAACYAAELADELGLVPEEKELLVWVIQHHHLPEQIAKKTFSVRDSLSLVQNMQQLKLLLYFVVADVVAANNERFLHENLDVVYQLIIEYLYEQQLAEVPMGVAVVDALAQITQYLTAVFASWGATLLPAVRDQVTAVITNSEHTLDTFGLHPSSNRADQQHGSALQSNSPVAQSQASVLVFGHD